MLVSMFRRFRHVVMEPTYSPAERRLGVGSTYDYVLGFPPADGHVAPYMGYTYLLSGKLWTVVTG